MKRAGNFLIFGLVIFSVSILCTSTYAQTATGSEGKKDFTSSVATHARTQSGINTNKSTKIQIADSQSNSKLNSPPVHSVNNTAAGKGTRNCQPKNVNKPYSITRDNFNKLPKDRQQFVLDNLNKYSIVD